MRGPCKEKGQARPPGAAVCSTVSASLQSQVEPPAQSLVRPWTSPLGEGGKSQSPPEPGLGGCAGSEARNQTEDVVGGVELEEGRGAHSHRVSEGSCWPWTWNRDEGAVHTGVGGLEGLGCDVCHVAGAARAGTTVLSPLSQPHGGRAASQGSPCHPEEIPVPESDTRPSPQL